MQRELHGLAVFSALWASPSIFLLGYSLAQLPASQAAGLGQGNPPDQAALHQGARLILPGAQKAPPESPGEAPVMLTVVMSRLLCVLQHEPRAAQSEGFPWRWVPPRMSCAQEARRPGARSGPPFSLLPGVEGWGLSGSIGLVPSLAPRGAGDRGAWLLAQSCFRSRRSGARTPAISTGASVDGTSAGF